MSGRRRTAPSAVFLSPTLIGAVTVLITVVAVFLAYNANQGLPFVQSYRLTATVPNAEALVEGNEIRIGGVRVGVVDQITPIAGEKQGTFNARLSLKLDTTVAELPVDSTVLVRARSALGLKYLQIVRGDSSRGYPEGSVLPLSAARPEPVEFDDFLSTFDEPTREAIQDNLTEFGNALAGRGPDLNRAIGSLKPLLPRLERVMRNISSPTEGIAPFFAALARSAAAVAPLAEQQARAVVNLDLTFAAFADVARPYIQESITEGRRAVDTAIETLPRIRPFLANTRGLFVDLQPGARAAAKSADQIEAALRAGVPALRASPILNRQLPPTAASLRRFNDDPEVRFGLNRLTDLAGALDQPLRFIGPAQYVCNYATLLLRNFADTGSQGNSTGNWQRVNALNNPAGPNNEGSPSSAPASGGGEDPRNFLHVNPYPNTASPGQTFECEAGNQTYRPQTTVIGNQPGNQGIVTEDQIASQLEATR